MPATTWTESSLSAKSDFQHGVATPVGTVDLVGDPWLTQPFFENLPVTFTESSVSGATWTESSVSSTSWTELT